MSDHQTKRGTTGPGKSTKEGTTGPAARADNGSPLEEVPDRLSKEELDAREAAKSPKRRPMGPPLEETAQDESDVPDVPATKVEKQ